MMECMEIFNLGEKKHVVSIKALKEEGIKIIETLRQDYPDHTFTLINWN